MTTQTITAQDRDAAVAEHGFHDNIMAGREAVKALGIDPSSDDDTAFGTEWVYCGQHLRPHATGWCTVSNGDKLPLFTPTGDFDEAYSNARAECESLGLKLL